MRLCWAFLVAAAVHAQAPSLLDQVKTRAAENLSRLPNYTCTETIERAQRQGKRGRIWPLDRVQVNVAYVNGKEFYGRVNEPKIDQPDLGQITGTPIGNGQFALFVKSIFSGRRAVFGSPAKTKLDGRPAFRFDYAIPLERSGLRIQSASGEAIVGYKGAFWASRDTLDLMRLDVAGQDFPRRIEITADVTTSDYGPVSIGGQRFLLPLESRWQTKDSAGSEARITTTFQNCHEFVGESLLKFGDP